MKALLLMNWLFLRDISFEELATSINISHEDFSRKFFGEDEFTTEEINRIAEVLGLTEQETDWIFYGGVLKDDFFDGIFM